MLRIVIACIGVACGVIALPAAAAAQVSSSDLLVRIDQLENQIRQLTGQIEQMEYRSQQLEATVRRLQDESDARNRGPARSAAAPPRQAVAPPIAPTVAPPVAPVIAPASAPPQPGRRSDAFDPAEHPDAPGAPRQLGSAYVTPPPRTSDDRNASFGGTPTIMAEEPTSGPLGAPGNPRGVNPSGQYAATTPTAPPSQTPRDSFDLGYGYVQRRDYALAEDTFRDFLRRYPADRLAAEAQYYLGESLYQLRDYRGAADAFLAMSKNYETNAKAPDALLRLGQSLAALNEKELACSTFGEVVRKYPRASAGVKQSVEREQKRVRC